MSAAEKTAPVPPADSATPPTPPTESHAGETAATTHHSVQHVDFRDWKPKELTPTPEDEEVNESSPANKTLFPAMGSFSSKSKITVKKNSTFALTGSQAGGSFKDINVEARRSMSFDRHALAKKGSAADGGRILVGKGLKRGKEKVIAFDELNEESHKVDDEILQNVCVVHPQKHMEEAAAVEGPEEDENACITFGHNKDKGTAIRRSSEVFIGGDGFFPLSQIKLPRTVYFTMRYDDFEDVKHLTDGSNSVIFKGKSGKMVSYHNSGIRIDSRVVLKVLSETVEDPRRAKREFDFERDILAAISHPNIVNIFGSGFHHDRPFLVMERLDGGSLQYLLTEAEELECRIPLRKALQIVRDLANALQYLHSDFHPDAVLIHRDLKPDNICFTEDGVVKLMDFGISTCMRRSVLKKKPYQMSGMTGSLRYMAPEVAKRLPYTEKVDMYSFGIVVWQVITSKTPYVKLNRERFMTEVVEGGSRPDLKELDEAFLANGSNKFLLDCCEEIKDICARCWDPDYQARPNMADLTDQLSQMYFDLAHGAASPGGCCAIM